MPPEPAPEAQAAEPEAVPRGAAHAAVHARGARGRRGGGGARAGPEAEPAADAPDGERDELEETPDFLQETPEHERLWFEQKPPKDFDF